MTTGAAIRVMLDTNVFDEFLTRPDDLDLLNSLSDRGLIVIVTTHVQADELADLPDTKRERRADLKKVYDRLKMTEVPTSAALWGISRWGKASFGDGSGNLRIGDIRTTNPKDSQDALIAVTAHVHANVFVTNEKTLPKRIDAKGTHLEVLTFEEFMNRMRAL